MSSFHRLSLSWMNRDAWLILVARGVRGLGQGSVSVLVGIYLHLLGFSPIQIGAFLSAGLAGASFFTFVVALIGDTLGRRRLMVVFTLMPAGAALVLASTDNFLLLAAVAFLGSLSVAGGGGVVPAQPLEQASLADTVSPDRRTDLYAVYNIMGIGGASLGALTALLPPLYQSLFGLAELSTYRIMFVTFAVLEALTALCYSFLSPSVEATISGGSRWVNPLHLPSRRLIFTLSALFSVDHFAGGLVAQSLVSLWFYTQFGMKLESIGLLFFGSNLMAAISLWAAAKLANRIGLINTMVFTHIPSSLFLIAIPFLPSVELAATFWLVRGFFGMMDVPTRQSYTMAVVGPGERSAMAGINSVTRSITGTVSPSFATTLWSIGAISIPFIACGVIKIVYDLTLYFMFRDLHPPEELKSDTIKGQSATRG